MVTWIVQNIKKMKTLVLHKGNRNFRLFYKIYFFDGRRTCCNHIIISEVYNIVDAISNYQKYINFLFKEDNILPELEIIEFKEIHDLFI